jgi:hypothetical protein
MLSSRKSRDHLCAAKDCTMLLKSTLPLSVLALAIVTVAPALRAQWTAPTKEELSMTSIPEVPGAPAIYLYKEQTADDAKGMHSFYVRLKVLTEGGKKYADVELPYFSNGIDKTVDDISGRTIQPDGTIVPFTGKPYEKTVVKGDEGYKYKVKIFTMPAVEVGSILEYRYKYHLDDHLYESPDWIVQTELFTRKAHYMWRPTDRELMSSDGKQVSSSVAWTPILPPGVTVKETQLAQASNLVQSGHSELDLDVHDIPPIPREQYMPPMESLSYKVLFYYTSVRSIKEYWGGEGKQWGKARDRFIGPGSEVRSQVQTLVGASDTPEQKLRKLYAFVMTLDNTDFSREHSNAEERAEGRKEVKTSDDVLTRKRGSGDQITELFVAMARAAGFKAYVMGVADRQERIFLEQYLNMRQLDDLVAIVNVDGKEIFLDPGSRYCTFGQLSWRHALTGGLRQTDNGVDLAGTPSSSYKDSHVSRIADLKLDDHGVATGTIRVTSTGDYALAIRQDALRGDAVSLDHELRTRMEHTLPGGMEVKVAQIENLTDPDQPLKVSYEVKGGVGTPTGKRLLVPATLFEINSKPKFPEAKRDLPIDMHFPSQIQDAVRYTLPSSMAIESAPTESKASIPNSAIFNTSSKTAGNSITVFRNLTVGKTLFASASYGDLRDFYTKVETKDQEPLVLTRSGAAPKPDADGGN